MKKILLLVVALFGMSSVASAQPVVEIVVDISEQQLFVQAPEGYAIWPVSTGKEGHDTPIGEFTVDRLEEQWYSRKYDNAPMPFSIFFYEGYAIHGTLETRKLGRPASKGCVRLHTEAAQLLYEVVEYYGMENTSIKIIP